MKRYKQHWYWKFALGSLLVIGGAIGEAVLQTFTFSINCAFAQITPDSTLPNNSRVTTQDNISIIEGGTQVGRNLFHSFQQFSVPNGGAAFFNNIADIQNIISRVTGGSVSTIDGIIGANGTANLFLINPNGIVFGQNAQLNIGGSFVATTANALQFDNQGFFNASNPNSPPLLTVNPSALLFNQITVQPTNSIESRAVLSVPDGQSLLLIGGKVSPNLAETGRILIDNGFLRAGDGRIELGGLTGVGTLGLNVEGNNLSLSFPNPQQVQRADVSLTNQSLVSVSGSTGGSIVVNAQNLDVLGESVLVGGIQSELGSVNSQAGDITLNATGPIKIAEGSFISNSVGISSLGKGGNINITAESLSAIDGAFLSASTYGRGNAGSVNINARDTVSFDGVSSDGTSSGAYSTVDSEAVGKSGDINIITGSLSLTDGAQLETSTDGRGNAGSININAHDTVSFDGIDSNGTSSGASSQVGLYAVGNGGDININTDGSLFLTNGALLIANSRGQGDGGNLNINAGDTVSFDGVDNYGFATAASSRLEKTGMGKGGDINIKTGALLFTNGAQLTTSSYGEGNAGNININARDRVSFDGVGRNGGSSSAFSTLEPDAIGKGGDININTDGSLFLTNGAGLLASTFGTGDTGSINIKAGERVFFDGVGSNTVSSGVFMTVEPEAIGNGRSINITTNSVSLTNGAQIQSILRTAPETLGGQGNAGNVNINARGTALFDGVGSNTFSSGVLSSVGAGTIGDGGEINITADSLSVTNGAFLSASTFGQGKGGNIQIKADDFVIVSGISSNGFSRGLLTSTELGAQGQSGEITVNTGAFRVADGAVVNAQTLNASDAGSITIKANTFEATGGGQVLTTTSGSGRAGNITINTTDSVTISGSDRTFYNRFALYGPERVRNEGPASGLFANTDINSTGEGGTISINPNKLTITEGAGVAVNSQGQGNAGNLLIQQANSITLDGQAFLSAATESGEGGNILLQAQDLLLLRRASKISAEAANNGNGGNININSGFIVAVPSENSDILANAFEGNGGNIQITSQGIFGIQPRSNPTSLSDITASSEFGVNGTVKLNTPDIDPNSGLVNLPAIPIDSRVAQGCTAGSSQAQSKFIITGRGGLPPNPGEALSADAVQVDLVALKPEVGNTPAVSTNPINPTSDRIVEATGWVTAANGDVILTSSAPTVTPHSSWQRTADCRVFNQHQGG
ncbi:MAG: filamentous hemagglutinin N-terminal domain-containing protein [Nostoc sp.]|uniref:two-partner secretion domain-containing protein n=1 Tax=Nostoc sp. TaxID=1180 RepID=UPI002FF4B8A0